MCYVRQESRCEELCSAFQWCVGYSSIASESYCTIYTLSGGCGHGTNMLNTYERIAKTIADLIPAPPGKIQTVPSSKLNCMAKTSGKILSTICFN